MSYVLIIGDSIWEFNADVGDDIAGYIARHYGLSIADDELVVGAVSGAGFLRAGIKTIRQQYLDAVTDMDGPPRVVIMDGGANDFIHVCDPYTGDPPCQTSADFWEDLWDEKVALLGQMRTDGVERCFYFGCYRFTGGIYSSVNPVIDYWWDNIVPAIEFYFSDICAMLPDPRTYWAANSQFIFDGVHPTMEGAMALAKWVIDGVDDEGAIEPNPDQVDHAVKSISLLSHGFATPANSTSFVDFNAVTIFNVLWDAGAFDGDDIYCRLEVDAQTSAYNANAAVCLYDVTGGAVVSGTNAKVLSASPYADYTTWRSPEFPASALTNGRHYRIRGRSGSTIVTLRVRRASLVIYQRGNVSKTQTHIPLVGVNHQDTGRFQTTSTAGSEVDSGNPGLRRAGLWKYEADKWDGTVEVYLEASMHTNNAARTAYAGLRDEFGNTVTGSTVEHSGTTNTRVRSGNFAANLIDGRTYRPVIATSAGTAYFHDIRLIVNQSDFRKTETYHRLACVGINNTPGTRSAFSGHTHFGPMWESCANIRFESCLAIDNSSATAYLYLKSPQEATDQESLSTQSVPRVLLRGADPLSLVTGYRYNPQIESSSSTHYARFTNPWVVAEYDLYEAAGPQDIEPTGIASAVDFGSHEVVPGAVTIAPSALPSGATFGSHVIALATQVLGAAAIASTLAFGAHAAVPSNTLSPAAIESGLAFGAHTVVPGTVNISPSALESSLVFGTHEAVPGMVTLAPSALPSGLNFGTHTVVPGTATLQPAALPSGLVFGTHTVLPGMVVLEPAALPSALSFGEHALAARNVLGPSTIPSELAFGAHAIENLLQVLQPAVLSSTLAFGSHSLVTENALLPSGIASTLLFGSHTMVPGTVVLEPAAIPSELAFGSHNLLSVYSLTPAAIESTLTFGSHALQAWNILSPSAILSDLAFGTHLIQNLLQILEPAGIPSGLDFRSHTLLQTGVLLPAGIKSTLLFGSHTVVPGTVIVQPNGIDSTLLFGSHTISAEAALQTLYPDALPSGLAFGSHTLKAFYVLQPAALPSGIMFGAHTLTAWNVLQVSRIESTLNIGTPTLISVYTLSPAAIPSDLDFGTAILTPFNAIQPAAVSSGLTFGSHTIRNLLKILSATRLPSGLVFGTHTIANLIQELFPDGIPSELVFGTHRLIRMLADPVKVKALDAIREALATVPGVGMVLRNPSKPIDHDTGKYSMIFICDEEEQKEQRNLYAIVTLPIQIEVWMRGKETDLSDLSDRMNADIRRKLLSDPGIRQWCNDIRPDPTNTMDKFHVDEFLGGFVSRYTVRFLHVWGNPYNKGN